MNSPQPAPGSAALGSRAQHRNWLRRLVDALVALVVIAVAGATFVFSYAGVHAIALLGGVSAQLAQYYPGLFDAVLVIACVSAVVLREGLWWARLWAWLVIFIVLGAIGTADVLHAMNYSLQHHPTEGIVAAAPVVAVLIAFSLLLTLLRQSRGHAPSAPAATPLDVPALPAAASAPPIALPAVLEVSPAAAAIAPAEPRDAQAEPTATVPVPTAEVPVVPLAEPVPAPAASPEPDVAQTAPDPVRADTLEAPQDAVPGEERDAVPGEEEGVPGEETALEEVAAEESHPAAEPDEVVSAADPTTEAAASADEPAPPAVEVPVASPPEQPQGIRYAGSGVRTTPPSQDYWDAENGAEDTEQFAGLVYRARSDDDDDDDAPADDAAARPKPPELDDDASPFATAPFAPMPRLNRVRSTPAPPTEPTEEDE